MTVTLHVDSTDIIIERVLDRELELGVVGLRRSHRALEFEPFLHDRVVLVVPSGHPFADRSVSVRELRAEPMIVMQPGAAMRRLMDDEFRRVGVRPRELNVAMEMGLQESAKSAVEAGFGVAFLSATAVAKELALGTLAIARSSRSTSPASSTPCATPDAGSAGWPSGSASGAAPSLPSVMPAGELGGDRRSAGIESRRSTTAAAPGCRLRRDRPRGVAEMLLLQRESLQAERVIWLHAPQIGTSAQGENPPKRVVGLPLLVQPDGSRSSRLLQ